jgi:outer membrane protein assembly factor BamB
MRHTLLIAAALSLTAAQASAETWVKYVDADGGIVWSYDADYTYRDRVSNRLVVMQAVAKPSANIGPSGPGKPDGVGSVVAIDCRENNMITLGSYKPSAPLDIKSTWRRDTPKKATGADNTALIAAVCAKAADAPVK